MKLPLPNIRCTMPKPCGHCHYCLAHAHGPLYWLGVKGPKK